MGTYPVTLTVTKVNGEENQAARKEANGTCMTVFKDFVQKVFVEEMTGTGCGWCPRGIVGMQLMKQKYGDRFVGVAIHRYNASTDPMAPREDLTLDDLPAGNAPLCIINRNGNQAVDPYFGSSGEKFGISRDIEKELYYGTAEVGVTVSGVWNADQTEVTATAVVEANIAGDFDVAFILVADSVVGDNAAWYQNNNYAQYDPADGGYAADPNLRVQPDQAVSFRGCGDCVFLQHALHLGYARSRLCWRYGLFHLYVEAPDEEYPQALYQ